MAPGLRCGPKPHEQWPIVCLSQIICAPSQRPQNIGQPSGSLGARELEARDAGQQIEMSPFRSSCRRPCKDVRRARLRCHVSGAAQVALSLARSPARSSSSRPPCARLGQVLGARSGLGRRRVEASKSSGSGDFLALILRTRSLENLSPVCGRARRVSGDKEARGRVEKIESEFCLLSLARPLFWAPLSRRKLGGSRAAHN